jgi:hypothetical protein
LLKGETRAQPGATELTPYVGASDSIVTSQASYDAGLFEVNFRDERLLPFEGAGAHAETGPAWRFKLSDTSELDFDSISDLVLHLRYTALDGRSAQGAPNPNRQALFRLRSELADSWRAFVSGQAPDLDLPLLAARVAKGRSQTLGAVERVRVFAQWKGNAPGQLAMAPPGASSPPAPPISMGAPVPIGPSLFKWTATAAWDFDDENAVWKLRPSNAANLADVWVIFDYTAV